MSAEHHERDQQPGWLKNFLQKIAQATIGLMEKWGDELAEKMQHLTLEELNERIASGNSIIAFIAAQELVRRSQEQRETLDL